MYAVRFSWHNVCGKISSSTSFLPAWCRCGGCGEHRGGASTSFRTPSRAGLWFARATLGQPVATGQVGVGSVILPLYRMKSFEFFETNKHDTTKISEPRPDRGTAVRIVGRLQHCPMASVKAPGTTQTKLVVVVGQPSRVRSSHLVHETLLLA